MNKDKLLKSIEEKYKKLGVPLDAMLEGLLWSTPITYWDYIQTDALLGLQIPRTDQPDEMVFIMYHQVNELLSISKYLLILIKCIANFSALTSFVLAT